MGRGLIFIVSGLIIIVGMTRVSTSGRIKSMPASTADYFYEQQARNISISLVDEAIQQLLKNNDWSGSVSSQYVTHGSGVLNTYDQHTITNLSDSVTVKHWDQYTVVLLSTATFEGYKVSTEVLMNRDSFSKYSYFTDNQPGNIYFVSDDVITGPVHTNGIVGIAGSPTFEGLVTSPNYWQGNSSYTNNPNFNGGTNFNAPNKPLDVSAQIAELKSKAASNGLTFTDRIKVVPKSDGTVDIYKYKSSDYWGNVTWYDSQNYNLQGKNGIITSTQEVDILGTINGQFTIHSSKDIRIIGDIEYNVNPLNNPNSTDFLGLVADNNIIVDKYAHISRGSNDITIQGSLMALNKSFVVENYDSGSARGTINLLGGIIQDTRGAVGTIKSKNGKAVIGTGFAKNYVYDERLRYSVPPAYPREKVFSILHWKDKVIERPTD